MTLEKKKNRDNSAVTQTERRTGQSPNWNNFEIHVLVLALTVMSKYYNCVAVVFPGF